MTFSLENLGCNSGHLSPKIIQQMGYAFIETSIGKQMPYPQMVQKIIEDLEQAKTLGMRYAIHLPLYLSEDWRAHYDCYDAFFLDPDARKREMAFEMLRDNLERLSEGYEPMYYVVHFPGVYPLDTEYDQDFETLLITVLSRLSALAEKHHCQIALEYFATNARFSDYRHWLKVLEPFANLKPLIDTGHLYFSCYKNGYQYDEVLTGLAPHCIGFHLWNIFGEGYYDQSSSYQKYHHIIPHESQTIEGGWAFNPSVVIPFLSKFDKPMLVEAGQQFEGEAYFLEGLIQIREMLRKSE